MFFQIWVAISEYLNFTLKIKNIAQKKCVTSLKLRIFSKKYQPIIHTDTTLHYATQQQSKKLFSPGYVLEKKISGFLKAKGPIF